MDVIRDLEELLLLPDEQPYFIGTAESLRIVVLKQFKYHKSLCIELYDVPLTKAGKIRNPFTPVIATDATLLAGNAVEAIKFYAAVSRFQVVQTTGITATDLRTLKTIIKNPLNLRFFLHNADFSENVSAGSLMEVTVGEQLSDLLLQLNKNESFFNLIPELTIGEQKFHPQQLALRFGLFIQFENRLLLAANLSVLKMLQVFATRKYLQIQAQQFKAFEEKVLSKLEEKIQVKRNFIDASKPHELELAGWKNAIEKLIYLAELGQYVTITPMMRYGNTELPVRSKKMVYLPDVRGRLIAMERDEQAENNFLAFILQQHPHFMEQVEGELPYFYLHRDRFLNEDWFLEAFEAWRANGITIFGFNQLKSNKKNAHKASITIRVLSGLNWFNIQVNAKFGKQKASLLQLQQAIRNKNRYVQLDDGTMGLLPEEWINRLSKFFFGASVMGEDLVMPGTQYEEMESLFHEAEMDPDVKLKITNYRQRLSDIKTIEQVAVPKGLLTTLRPYQQEGLNWLYFLHQQQFGGVLADDMGLGKTIQVIAFLLLLKEKNQEQPHLLVVPTSLLFNWQMELNRFAPSLVIKTIHGANRQKEVSEFEKYDLLLTSYGTLLTDITYLRRFQYGYILLDESQQIKNPDSQRYHAVQMIRANNRLAITGTPFENNTMDLFGQFSFACPGLLGSKKYFQDIYSTPIDRFENQQRLRELQQKVAPFLLRRIKQDVMQELPDKTEQVLYCSMGEAQRAVYEFYEKLLRDYLEGKMEDEIQRNSIHVLRGLTQLRQICNDPRLLKADQLQGEGSAKIDLLLEQVQLKAPRHKILIFSQFVSMLELIAAELDKTGLVYETLTGATKDREGAVHRFQQDASVRVFLLSLKAGGVGLNLTAASYVYLVDPWWNPAVEDQAIDRAYRIGQHQNVQAIRLICKDTVEEKMRRLQQNKKERSAGLIQSGKAFFTNMTKEDWKAVLG